MARHEKPPTCRVCGVIIDPSARGICTRCWWREHPTYPDNPSTERTENA